MPNTITEFYVVSPGTKARSSEANANWGNMRGTFLPINEDTASASDGVHNLGSLDHRWGTVYTEALNLAGLTSTAALTFQTLNLTAGGMEILSGATTITSFTTNGMRRKHLDNFEQTTSSNVPGTAIVSSLNFYRQCMTTSVSTVASYRFTCRGGGTVQFSVENLATYFSSTLNGANLTSGAYYYLLSGLTTTALTVSAYIFSRVLTLTPPGQTFPGSLFHDTSISVLDNITFPIGQNLNYSYFGSPTGGNLIFEIRTTGQFSGSASLTGYILGTTFIREL